ncbi:MAG: rod shape-determining protein MreD [Rhodocyclaceae bacterium]|nr:rod shape-determining protein MreD [Rhodocyclaceae bacterium]
MNTAYNPGERRGRPSGQLGAVLLSVAAALALDLVSMGATLDALRPDLTLLVLLYWSTRQHSPANVWTAWAIGLLRDVATLNPLGLHAGLYCLSAWVGMGLRKRLETMPLPGELLLVFLVLLSGSVLSWGVGLLIGGRPSPESHLASPLIGTLIWPVIRIMLDARRGRRSHAGKDD